ncbi:ATP-dependent DNA helicase [bacterium]|nr:ATP-dependent DNA helicase [bacterium]
MIRFDDAARAVTLSVRDVADDGDHRFAGPLAVGMRKRAEMGRDAHELHQGAREGEVASYRRERSLRYETTVDGWRVVVVGRIDGVYTDQKGRTVIEEVKTVLAAPEALEAMDERTFPAYARQLQLYRHLLEESAAALGFDEAPTGTRAAPEIALDLCLIALPSKARRSVVVSYDRDACRAHVETRLRALVREHEADLARRGERRAQSGAVRFPFAETREHQDAMVAAVETALRERRPILVSAPPGIGKTAGALVPALRYAYEIGGRVFVATSKTTQQRIFAETLRIMRESGTPVRSVVLVAKEKACLNDVVTCHPEACRYAKDYHEKLETSGAIERLARLPIADQDAVREEAKAHVFCPFEAALDLTAHVDVIVGDYNYVFDPQAALRRMFVDEAPDDVVLVIDEAHNLYERGAEYYSPELARSRIREVEASLAGAQDPVRRRIRGLLRDLDSHLASIESGSPRVSSGKKDESGGAASGEEPARPANLFLWKDPEAEAEERRKAARRTERRAREARTSARRAAQSSVTAPTGEVEPEPVAPASEGPPLPPEREIVPEKAFFLSLRDELDELMVAYFIERRARAGGAAPQAAAVAAAHDPVVELHRLVSRFASVLELEGDEWSYIYRRGGPAGGAIKILCKDPSRQLGRRIRACAGAVAVSATLEPLEFYRDVLGFPREETELRAFASPFPLERRRVVVLDRPSTYYKDLDRDLPIVEDAIRAVVAARPGNYLAAFPSFEYLEMLAPRVASLPGFEVLRQERRTSDAERAAILARLQEYKGPPGRAGRGGAPPTQDRPARPPVLLLAVQGGVFTEGVDYPGEMCVGAIIVGPGLPRWSFERELVKTHFDRVYGRGFEYAYLYPGMSRVIQAAGRVIRTATDVGVVALVGDRFATERYASLFPRDWFVRHPRELVASDPYSDLVRFWARVEGNPREPP